MATVCLTGLNSLCCVVSIWVSSEMNFLRTKAEWYQDGLLAAGYILWCHQGQADLFEQQGLFIML